MSSFDLKPEKIVAETFIDQTGLIRKLSQHIWDKEYQSKMIEASELPKYKSSWIKIREYILKSDVGNFNPNYPGWVEIKGTAIFSAFLGIIKVKTDFHQRKQVDKKIWKDWYYKLYSQEIEV